jgi:hypothetical protein
VLQVQQFWADIDSNFPYYRTKPHFMAIGRREAELLGGCGVDDKMYTKASVLNHSPAPARPGYAAPMPQSTCRC